MEHIEEATDLTADKGHKYKPINLKLLIWESRTLITRSRAFAPLGAVGLRTLSWLLRHNPQQLRSTRIKKAAYLNAGCGKRPRQGFVNLDFTWQPGVDLLWDLNWALPFPDGSLKGIYTEHCLEHLPFEVVTGHVLTEFHRVLARNGRLRLIVPDAGLYLKLYVDSRQDSGVRFPFPNESFVTPMMHVNRCFRDHGHLYAYDFESFRYFLLKAGFSLVEQCSFMSGGDPTLFLDSEERAPESLYIEAVR